MRQRGGIFLERHKIDRINELAHISKTRELSSDEKSEQKALRREYIEAVKRNFRMTLESIEIKD